MTLDELDEDYGAGAAAVAEEYWQLLTSLFKAVQDVRAVFRAEDGYHILPVVFLREDIYSQLQDSDKTKWEDLIFRLEWTPSKIQQLLAFRISRAANRPLGDELGFLDAWSMLFQASSVRFGKGRQRKMGSFEFITRAGCWRPRDYVRYMKATAQRALDKGVSPVPGEFVYQAQREFSDYLRSEMVDEIAGILPNIDDIMNIVAHIRKPIFSFGEFRSVFNSSLASSGTGSPSYEDVLRTLFHFSVLGNWTRRNTAVFRYTNRTATLNPREQLMVHPGLLRTFQL